MTASTSSAGVLAPLVWPAGYETSLLLAGAAWTLAFGLFVAAFAPILTRPRIDGRPR